MQKLSAWLFRETDGSTLATFRIAFGVIAAMTSWKAWTAWPHTEYSYRPTYRLLTFLADWPFPSAKVACLLMGIGAAGLILGLLTRVSAALFATVFTYCYTLNPCLYNNHFYLISLLAFWLIFVRSEASWSLDALLLPRWKSPTVPFWHVGIVQWHLMMVYFYGGLTKLTPDWFHGEPTIGMLKGSPNSPLIRMGWDPVWLGYFISYFGLIFDFAIPFLLVWRKSRPYAIVAVVLFHLANSQLFDIGVFPWLGISSLVVFLEPDTPRRFVGWLRRVLIPTGKAPAAPRSSKTAGVVPGLTTGRRILLAGLGVYWALQLLLPFRHFLYPGWVDWNTEGKNFSWRMMSATKKPFVGMRLTDRATGKVWEVDQGGMFLKVTGKAPGKACLIEHPRIGRIFIPSRLMSFHDQLSKRTWESPRLLAQYARFVAEDARKAGLGDPAIHVDAVASLNGRPFQYLVDPKVDLANADLPLFGTPSWTVPLKPNQPIGDYPKDMEEWQARVMNVIRVYRLAQQQKRRPQISSRPSPPAGSPAAGHLRSQFP